MRTGRKIAAVGLACLTALTGILTGVHGEPTESLPPRMESPIRGLIAATDPSKVVSMASATNYTNVTTGTFWTQDGDTMKCTFGTLAQNEYINLAIEMTGTPYSSGKPLSITAVFDNMAGTTTTHSLKLTAKPTTEVTDTQGNLSVLSEDTELGIRFKVTHVMGGKVTFTIKPGGSKAIIYRGSAYKGPKYRGFIEFEGESTTELPDYRVESDGTVTIKANPDTPITPGQLQDGIIAYDEYEQRFIRPVPVGNGLKTYAEKYLEGFKVGDEVIVEFQATDKSGNTTTLRVVVRYVDDIPPTITVDGLDSKRRIAVPYSTARTLPAMESAILSHVTVTDNVRPGIVPTVEIDDFQPVTMGEFDIVISAYDGYNTSTWEGTLYVYDDLAPEISGPSSITTAVTSPLTAKGILEFYTIIDEIDGEDVSVSLADDSYHSGSNSVKVGTYTATIVAYDSSGNSAEKQIKIAVEDQEGPVWYVYGMVLTVLEESELSPMEIVQRLVDEGSIDDLNYARAEIILGDPIDGTQAPGNYKMTIRAETDDGLTRFVNLTLSVLPRSSDIIEANPPKKLNGFLQFFVDVWNSIVAFFSKLFGKA